MDITKDLLVRFISGKKIHALREIFDEYNIVDLSEVVQTLAVEQILFLFKILKQDTSAELFSYLDPQMQEKLVKLFTGPQIKDILDNLYSDDLIEFMDEMPANIVKFILDHATMEQRQEINKLLSYPDNSAGSIMTTDFVSLNVEDDIASALLKLRQQVKKAELISTCFIEDDFNRLVGYIHLYDLVFENPSEKIVNLMESDVIKVSTLDDQEMVAKKFEKYDFNAIPVVNEKNNLVGVVTVDDIIDVIHEETTEDIQKIWAISPTEESYLDTSVLKMSRARIVWLLVLMVSATITGGIMASYESALAISGAVIFVPMLMNTAGNAGAQAATMVIRSLAIGEIQVKDFVRIWIKELKVSILCGVIVGAVNFLRILVFQGQVDFTIAVIVSVTVCLAIITSALIASTLPIIAVKLKQDPAVMAAPLITTIVDAIVLFMYFSLIQTFLF